MLFVLLKICWGSTCSSSIPSCTMAGPKETCASPDGTVGVETTSKFRDRTESWLCQNKLVLKMHLKEESYPKWWPSTVSLHRCVILRPPSFGTAPCQWSFQDYRSHQQRAKCGTRPDWHILRAPVQHPLHVTSRGWVMEFFVWKSSHFLQLVSLPLLGEIKTNQTK